MELGLGGAQSLRTQALLSERFHVNTILPHMVLGRDTEEPLLGLVDCWVHFLKIFHVFLFFD